MIISGSEIYKNGDLQFMLEQDGKEYHCGIAQHRLHPKDLNDPAKTLAQNWSWAKDGFGKLSGPAYHRLN